VMSLQDKCDIYRGKSDCLLRMDIAALSLWEQINLPWQLFHLVFTCGLYRVTQKQGNTFKCL
jgi:hypothetical protein